MEIVRGTTPTLVCSFTSGVDLTEAANVYARLRRGGVNYVQQTL